MYFVARFPLFETQPKVFSTKPQATSHVVSEPQEPVFTKVPVDVIS